MLDLIKSQVLTDKSGRLLRFNRYAFDVDKRMTKLKFRIILEEVFNVKVISINSMILPVKRRRLGKFEGVKNSYKRIYVTLSADSNIPYFSSL